MRTQRRSTLSGELNSEAAVSNRERGRRGTRHCSLGDKRGIGRSRKVKRRYHSQKLSWYKGRHVGKLWLVQRQLSLVTIRLTKIRLFDVHAIATRHALHGIVISNHAHCVAATSELQCRTSVRSHSELHEQYAEERYKRSNKLGWTWFLHDAAIDSFFILCITTMVCQAPYFITSHCGTVDHTETKSSFPRIISTVLSSVTNYTGNFTQELHITNL